MVVSYAPLWQYRAHSHDSSDGVHLDLALGDNSLGREDGRSVSDGVRSDASLLLIVVGGLDWIHGGGELYENRVED